ncbi:MAG: hypothetical protein ACUVUC_09105 [Thermoguttaceae bacterium]
MGRLWDDELLSAYLDGELTAAQQAAVEQLLATSPEARQLLDELRALSATLQSLPPYKLQEDLAEQVLRTVERRMLSEPAGSGPAAGLPGQEVPLWRAIARRLLRPRTLLWPALAVAAALLIMALNPDQWAPEKEPAEASRVAMSPKAGPAPPAEPRSIGAPAEARAEADRRLREQTGGLGTAPADHLARPVDRDVAEKSRELSPAGLEGPPEVEQRPPWPGSARGTAPARAKPPGAGVPAAALAERMRPLAEKDEAGGSESKPGKGELEPAGDIPKGAEPAAQPLFVYCDLSPEAVRENAFQQVMDQQQVLTRPLAPGGEATSRRPAQTELYVQTELTPLELEAVLADLKARPGWFLSVSPGPPPPELLQAKPSEQASFQLQAAPHVALTQQAPQPKPEKTEAPAEAKQPGLPGPARRSAGFGAMPGMSGARSAPMPGGAGAAVPMGPPAKPSASPFRAPQIGPSAAPQSVQVPAEPAYAQPARWKGQTTAATKSKEQPPQEGVPASTQPLRRGMKAMGLQPEAAPAAVQASQAAMPEGQAALPTPEQAGPSQQLVPAGQTAGRRQVVFVLRPAGLGQASQAPVAAERSAGQKADMLENAEGQKSAEPAATQPALPSMPADPARK